MVTVERSSTGEAYTRAWARSVASLMRAGDTIAMEGPMGAGKTTIVRGLALGLGVAPGLVSSPTFVVVNVYPVGRPGAADRPGSLVHVDAYRVLSTEELDNAGWDALFDASTGRPRAPGAAVIEWPRRIADAIAADAARLVVEPVGASERTLTLSVPDDWARRAGFDLFASREPKVCPVTGAWVEPTAAAYPFATDRARLADLNKWFTGAYWASRPATDDELDGPAA